LGVACKTLAYVVLVLLGMLAAGQLLAIYTTYFVASVMSVFLAAALANFLAMHLFEKAHLADIGLGWTPASVRNLLVGLAGGTGAACVVLLVPLLAGAAEFQSAAHGSAHWGTFLFVTVLLVFGAVGEEMVFRGYGFQILLDWLGPFATILPVGVLFAWAHSSNLNVSPLGLINTGLWGILLGWAFVKSRDLWLPIGLHLGWNWALPLFGVNLSGFTIGVTGYEMRWKVGPFWSGGQYGPEGGILTTMVLLALSIYLLKAPIRKQTAFLLRSHQED
jgi:hypothetical protein